MKKFQQGSITPPVLIISGAFIIVVYALLLILSLQLDFSHRQVASEQALHIAEAGVNYYRWHLAHDPDDFQDGTGESGPYIHDYYSSVVTISSTGWTDQYSRVKRTITAQYGKPSLARFSFLQNASSWYGNGITVYGQIHSNNGIRMDGVNMSLVTSAMETYLCGSETGCWPPEYKEGVWGSGGGDHGLWQFPVPVVDFDAISFDFAYMRQQAQEIGLYLAPSGRSGYHLVFNADGTVTVYQVTRTRYYRAYDPDDGCRRRYQRADR